MDRGDAFNRLLLPATALVLTVGLAIAVAQLGVSVRTALIAAVAAVLVVPLVVRLLTHSFDILEPIVGANIALFAMFVARPIAMLLYDEMQYGSEMRFDLNATFSEALFVALVGVVAMNLGYATHFGALIGAKAPRLASRLHHDTAVASAVGFIVLGMTAYALYALQRGFNPLSTILGGGIRGGGEGTTAYLYIAPFMVIPAALIFLHVGQSSKTVAPRIIAIALAIIVAHTLAPAGQRQWLLLLLASLVVYPMLRTGWRPTLGLVLLALIPALFVIVAMRDLRYDNPGQFISSIAESVSDPAESAEKLFLGADTEMFSGIAAQLQLTPEVIPFDTGNTLATVVTKPIPRVFFPDKPRPVREVVNSVMRPKGHRLGGQGIEFSPIGPFYGDSGLFGVAAGMFAIGVGLRGLFQYLNANRENDLVRLFYAIALPLFTVILLRGNLDDTLGRAFFLIGPLIVISILANRAGVGERTSTKATEVT